MTQFASTLYPQTNPSNAVLLGFRTDCDCYRSSASAARAWLDNWTDLTTYGPSFRAASDQQIAHANRVLARLAALSG